MKHVRIERLAAYNWWVPGQDTQGTVRVMHDGDGRCRVVLHPEDDFEFDVHALPALIAALTAYVDRLNANANEVAK